MKTLEPTTKFKKDLKKYKNKPDYLEELKKVLKLLENELPIPAEYKPHSLQGDYKDCMECHIQNDYLLIWFDAENDVIKLVRLGSHSELFK
ncbi:MAG: type II toxin-antitoxin system YafQ family toxin [Bacteroidales bacterium]|nr:type II toxin-antitoxin system YafQ family toxin [Bacteroidales bacterium]